MWSDATSDIKQSVKYSKSIEQQRDVARTICDRKGGYDLDPNSVPTIGLGVLGSIQLRRKHEKLLLLLPILLTKKSYFSFSPEDWATGGSRIWHHALKVSKRTDCSTRENFRPVFDVYSNTNTWKCIEKTRVHQDKEMITAYFFYLFSEPEKSQWAIERTMNQLTNRRFNYSGYPCQDWLLYLQYHSFLSFFLSFLISFSLVCYF